MLLIDSDLVLHLVSGEACVDEDTIVSRAVALISRLEGRVHCQTSDVVIAVVGVGPADVVERWRREAYARPCSLATLALPGTRVIRLLASALTSMGWTVSSTGGCCLVTMAQQLNAQHTQLTLFARSRDAAALIALCPFPLKELRREGYASYYTNQSLAHGSVCADSVVLDILTGGFATNSMHQGVLVQSLPGLPRMHVSEASNAMHRSYQSWRDREDNQGTLVTGRKLDRRALAEVLVMYVEEADGGEDDNRFSGSELGWRDRYTETHFPHGFEGACAQYLDAIERELIHLAGEMVSSPGVYVHGCAPPAMHLLIRCLSAPSPSPSPSSSLVCISPHSWTPEMQVSVILPAHAGQHWPHHTCLDLGCVHMFPVTYQVWWGTYPVIPALDFNLLHSALALQLPPRPLHTLALQSPLCQRGVAEAAESAELFL